MYSKGGISQEAIHAANYIRENEINLFVLGTCTSACAEFLLPAAKTLTFIEEPFIGFHGNTVADMDFVQNEFGKTIDYCSSIHASDVKQFLAETLGRDDFWKSQYKYMEVTGVRFENFENKMGYKCVQPIIDTKQSIWYPSSSQLRTVSTAE